MTSAVPSAAPCCALQRRLMAGGLPRASMTGGRAPAGTSETWRGGCPGKRCDHHTWCRQRFTTRTCNENTRSDFCRGDGDRARAPCRLRHDDRRIRHSAEHDRGLPEQRNSHGAGNGDPDTDRHGTTEHAGVAVRSVDRVTSCVADHRVGRRNSPECLCRCRCGEHLLDGPFHYLGGRLREPGGVVATSIAERGRLLRLDVRSSATLRR